MDPKIWSNLPEELLDRILSFLPLKTLFSLRPTCKRFKSLLLNPFFISNLSSSSSSNFSSFILLSHPHFSRHFPLYDTVSSQWRRSSPASRRMVNPCTSSSSSLLSSSNGVLCFLLPTFSLLVINPLSLSSTTVEFPKLPFSFDMLTLVSLGSKFVIFALSSNDVVLYDSEARSWAWFDGFEPVFNDIHHQEAVHRDGSLYFTTADPVSIARFDLSTGNWSDSSLSNRLPTNDLAFIRLTNGYDGSIYMIGGVGPNGISRCLKLWVMRENGGWDEVETLPELMYKKFVSVCYHNYEHVYCFWHQGLICICCYNWPEVLYYRVARGTWHWLPKCPSLPERWSCGFRWFSFVPRLGASV